MQNKRLLIVFAKNPLPGKVKTRLASTIGDSSALEIYKTLLYHTLKISTPLENDKVVYYADFIPSNDLWKTSGYIQQLQTGDDLGQKMMNAFRRSFYDGYHSVIIIGSDCPEITADILIKGFDELDKKDVVIGPAQDGGYYLLGMKKLYEELFFNKTWSSKNLLEETFKSINDLNLSFSLLQELRDIDTEEDLNASSLSAIK